MSWKITPINHKGEARLKVEFKNIPALNNQIRKIKGATFSGSLQAWHVPDTPESRVQLNMYDPRLIVESTKEIKAEKVQLRSAAPELPIIEALKQFEYYLRAKRYRESTIKSYKEALASFLKFWSHKLPKELSSHDLLVYNNEYIVKHKLSASYQNQVINAIKLFYKNVENAKIEVDEIYRPKSPKQNPNVLSKEEVKRLLTVVANRKHKAMLSITYACGLRCGEVLNLKLHDIDGDRKVVYVKDAKGAKDRMVPIGEKLLEELRTYFLAYRPLTYLFEGVNKGEKYDERSLQTVLKQNLKKARINKPATLHWLRHSYATHLMDAGTDLRFIQQLLGHRSSRTTEIYTHVSNRELKNINSPFDSL